MHGAEERVFVSLSEEFEVEERIWQETNSVETGALESMSCANNGSEVTMPFVSFIASTFAVYVELESKMIGSPFVKLSIWVLLRNTNGIGESVETDDI